MRRPGFLNGYEGFTPKAVTFSLKGFHGSILDRFTGSGKGSFEPPPEPPPPGEIPLPIPPGPPPKTIAEYLKTRQDKRCSEGERITTIPCQGPGCDPGETEGDCLDDPLYQKLEAKEEEEEEEEAKRPAPKRAVDPEEKARLQAELKQLETESATISAMPRVAVMAPPSAYTGGGMPAGLPSRARKAAPSREQQVESIVSEFETRKAIRRTRAPRSAPRPKLAPIPAAPPPRPPPKEDTGGLFSWLKNALFGSYDDYVLSGLGEQEHFDTTKLIITVVVVLGIFKLMQKKT